MGVEGFDYDSDPDRFRSNVKTVELYGLQGDVHTEVADRVAAESLWPVLDMGCGEGRLRAAIGEKGLLIATDLSMTMLHTAPDPKMCSDMTRLPVAEGSFGSVAALWCLYHLPRPADAIREAHRVLRSGGLFVTCVPSIHNDPEFAHLFPDPKPSSFDSEFAADLVSEVFGRIEVDRWDTKAIGLPDVEAAKLYLRGRGMSDEQAAKAAESVETPVKLTKRGALVWGYKRNQ